MIRQPGIRAAAADDQESRHVQHDQDEGKPEAIIQKSSDGQHTESNGQRYSDHSGIRVGPAFFGRITVDLPGRIGIASMHRHPLCP